MDEVMSVVVPFARPKQIRQVGSLQAKERHRSGSQPSRSDVYHNVLLQFAQSLALATPIFYRTMLDSLRRRLLAILPRRSHCWCYHVRDPADNEYI